MKKIIYSNDYTILNQKIIRYLVFIGHSHQLGIDYENGPFKINKDILTDFINNLNKCPFEIKTKINYSFNSENSDFPNISNYPIVSLPYNKIKNLHLFTKSGLDLRSENLTFKIIKTPINGEESNKHLELVKSGYICCITDQINYDILWLNDDFEEVEIEVFINEDKSSSITIDLYFEVIFFDNKNSTDNLLISKNIEDIKKTLKVTEKQILKTQNEYDEIIKKWEEDHNKMRNSMRMDHFRMDHLIHHLSISPLFSEEFGRPKIKAYQTQKSKLESKLRNLKKTQDKILTKNSVKIWGGRINCIGLAYPIKCLQCLIFDTEEKIFSSDKDGIISHEGIQNIK